MLVLHPCEATETTGFRDSVSKRLVKVVEPHHQTHQSVGPSLHSLPSPSGSLAHTAPELCHRHLVVAHDKQAATPLFQTSLVHKQKPIKPIWTRLDHRSLPVPRPVRFLSHLLRSVRHAAARLPLRPRVRHNDAPDLAATKLCVRCHFGQFSKGKHLLKLAMEAFPCNVSAGATPMTKPSFLSQECFYHVST